MAKLREDYGVRSILCEGGPTLNSHLLAAGLVDELFLTLSSKLAGGAAALTIVAAREVVEPADLELVWVLEGGGNLFTRCRAPLLVFSWPPSPSFSCPRCARSQSLFTSRYS